MPVCAGSSTVQLVPARAYRLTGGAWCADVVAGCVGRADRVDLAARIARGAELPAEFRGGDGDHRPAREPPDEAFPRTPRGAVAVPAGARNCRIVDHRTRRRGRIDADRAVPFPQGGALWRPRQCRRDPADELRLNAV